MFVCVCLGEAWWLADAGTGVADLCTGLRPGLRYLCPELGDRVRRQPCVGPASAHHHRSGVCVLMPGWLTACRTSLFHSTLCERVYCIMLIKETAGCLHSEPPREPTACGICNRLSRVTSIFFSPSSTRSWSSTSARSWTISHPSPRRASSYFASRALSRAAERPIGVLSAWTVAAWGCCSVAWGGEAGRETPAAGAPHLYPLPSPGLHLGQSS